MFAHRRTAALSASRQTAATGFPRRHDPDPAGDLSYCDTLDQRATRPPPPAAKSDPSGDTAMLRTAPLNGNVALTRPVCTSQSLTLPSELPEASVCPSATNATDQTVSLWPVNVRSNSPVVASQIS